LTRQTKKPIPNPSNEPTQIFITNKKNILRDFSFWFALAALGISAYTIFDSNNQLREQNKKWRAINLGRVSVIEAKYYIFREVTWEVMHRDSLEGNQYPVTGYNPNYVEIENMIVAFDSVTKHNVPYTSAITVTELIEQLHRRKIYDFSHMSFQKYYKPIVTIQNVGQTSCTIDSILLSSFIVDPNKVEIENGFNLKKLALQNFNLEPGQKFPTSRLEFDVQRFVPVQPYKFKFQVYYTDIEGEQDIIKTTVNFNGLEFLITNDNE